MRLCRSLSQTTYRYSPMLIGLIALPVHGHESPAVHSHLDSADGSALSALAPSLSALAAALLVMLALRWWRARR